MELRVMIEQATQYQEGLSTRDKIEEGRKQLFDFDYPIFDESFKKVFETHFIRHFYMREIGFETGGHFKFKLETWLSINMPYFNELFKSETIQYDPLINSEMNTTGNTTTDHSTSQSQNTNRHDKGSSTNNQTSQQTDDNFGRDIKSDNPDSRLHLTTNDGEGVVEYASDIIESTQNNKANGESNAKTNDENNTDSSTDGTSQVNDIQDFIQSRSGKSGTITYSEMVQKYREALLRIERQVFWEMNELFMLVY